MLRAIFIFLSKLTWAQRMMTNWGVARRVASRFIAGETGEEAIQVIETLNAAGLLATLDFLGENTTTPEEARQSADEILHILERIHESGVRSNVSIKLSQIGVLLDEERCLSNLVRILEKARLTDNFVRIDMEDSTLTEKTLDVLRQVRKQGYENVGIVIQSYLYRSTSDVNTLMSEGIRVRLVKGAYREPITVAYPNKVDVDIAFDKLTELLIVSQKRHKPESARVTGRFPPIPAIATHDASRIQHALDLLKKYGLSRDSIEFQMLYGIRRDLQQELAAAGYPVRVYVPYGTHWYPYFMRRLAERPANVWFFFSNLFRH
jgi:proline dehydrogenase